MTLTMTEEQQKNLAVAQQLNHETRANPDSPYAGKYISVLHQQVVAVADSLDELDRRLEAIAEDTKDAIWIEASADHDHTYMI